LILLYPHARHSAEAIIADDSSEASTDTAIDDTLNNEGDDTPEA
jgi:hypothetical protein